MLINDEKIKKLSLNQLREIDNSMEAFLFKQTDPKEEPYEPSLKKDQKQFNRLISTMVALKRDVMKYFVDMYQHRNHLIKMNLLRMDEYDDYLYDDFWDEYDDQLAAILEQHKKNGFDLGVMALGLSLGISYDYSSADAQDKILQASIDTAKTINTTTKQRAIAQIKTSLGLNENREALEERLRKVFSNPYRGRFIAQQETLSSYMDGKEGLAINQDLGFKTALSSQATDSICGDINGETVPIDEPFSNGFMKPLYHYGCRCDIEYSRSAS